ncbi:MAG: class I SAM-dependent methyltransferase [Rhizobiaceae bacterium]|nr:class I SAM-dependent methyltransferase [Rhizobiaceae bacterium]
MDSRPAIALHPFETGMVDLPNSGARGLMLNALPGMRRPEGFKAELALVQDLRPLFLPLQTTGHEISPEPEGSDYDLSIALCGRHRRQNELWVAQALERTRSGGLIVVAGGKTDGIASLKKRVGSLVELAGSESKYHGVVFWLTRPRDADDAIDALTPPPGLVDGRFVTGAGMFSADRVDPGSRLLAESLPADLKGAAADFGAGWGYLSAALAERHAMASIDLYEASHAALEAAKVNMNKVGPDVARRYFWHDLLAEPMVHRYDVIVMNPPFHQGRAAEPEIGIAMVKAALGALKKGGRLFMVANKGLPYENILKAEAASYGELAQDARFRVLMASK